MSSSDSFGTQFPPEQPALPGGFSTVNGIVKMDGAGNASAATAGVDYQIPANCWWTLQGSALKFDPTDATTYYIGNYAGVPPSTFQAGISGLVVPLPGTIKVCSILLTAIDGVGSNETSSMWLRLNAATDTLVSNAVKCDSATSLNIFTNAALNIAVVAGDFLELKWTTPTWVTNPTGLAVSFALGIQ